MLNIPLSYADFQANYFEQKTALFSGVLHEPLMQWHDIDVLLNTQEPDERRMQVFLNGQVPPPHFLDEVFEFGRVKKRINKDRFYKLLQHGATLVINQVEEISMPAKKLCSELAHFARQTTSCNAYMSAGAAGTFGKHWDTHDVFAVQLIGKKRWQIFEPSLALPLSHQTSTKFGQPPSGPPCVEYTMCEGDLLYIPRGWWHEVTPITGESLHLSIGTYPPTVLDYVIWVCRTQLPHLLDARKSCGLNASDPALAQLMQHLMQQATHQNNFDAFINAHRANEKPNSEFHTEFMLAHPKNLSDDMELSLTSSYAPELTANEMATLNTQLKLNMANHALMDLLRQTGTLAWREVRNRLPTIPEAALQQAAMDLSRHELINLHTPNSSGEKHAEIDPETNHSEVNYSEASPLDLKHLEISYPSQSANNS